jgi:formylglycine-generating enzyme required for sulfatase activity
VTERPASTEEALELFLSNRRRGDETSPEEFAARHAELGPELGAALQALAALEGATRGTADEVLPERIGDYRIVREIGRGGMGAILRVWDEELGRHLAMKVALGDAGASGQLERFLEEARVTGRLDHPGIVPVHELGLDAQGRRFFTMKLVEGRDMKQILELVFAGKEGWNQTRALGVILKVCEAMAYAHSKGIIHRDLKPANVMVGGFGEVFVMDWGLARVLDRADPRDMRLADKENAEHASASHLLTVDGAVLGTPAYMPPEQARGDIEALSPRSDVYSVGAMLYHLLARQMPYVPPGTRSPAREVLERVRAGPPAPLHELNAQVPAELAAICEKAMARDPAQRYAGTLAFAEDLRAFLEGRVVAAYETGALAELRKWIARNRALAAACGAAILILAAGLVVSSSLSVTARRERARADERTADVLSLSAGRDLQMLVERADALWPASAANVPAFEQWLREAHALLDGRAADPERGIKAAPGLAGHKRKLAELEARAGPGMVFANSDDAWWHAELALLVAGLETFANPETGLCGRGTDPAHGWGIERRLEFARGIEQQSLLGAEAAQRWREAIDSIQDRAQCPRYAGLVLVPQLGLLPLGRSARSGLWEFAHLQTGAVPQRGPDGEIVPREGDGLVFVLLPGGSFHMGAQAADPAAPNYDSRAKKDEAPVHEVGLEPFFVSKFEMTQDQWWRWTGANPSVYKPGLVLGGIEITPLHPVEQLSWRAAAAEMQRLDLLLPTEAQWEYAARAGTESVWWTGNELASLAGAANLSDSFAREHGGPSSWSYEASIDDGFKCHSPVGSFRPNAFGLFDCAGNVYEFCRDAWGTYEQRERDGDGEREGGPGTSYMIRGGAYHTAADGLRSAFRTDVTPTYTDFSLGVRPARRLVR